VNVTVNVETELRMQTILLPECWDTEIKFKIISISGPYFFYMTCDSSGSTEFWRKLSI